MKLCNKLLIGFFILIALGLLFKIPNLVRYSLEKHLGNPVTFFYQSGIGVMKPGENWYDQEINLDDNPHGFIKISAYSQTPTLYFFSSFINSNDPVLIACNGIPLNSGLSVSSRGNHYFWERYYLDKIMVIPLDHLRSGNNTITVVTGKAKETYYIELN